MLRRRLPISAALRTLPALDQLLRQLAAAAKEELHQLHAQHHAQRAATGARQAAAPHADPQQGGLGMDADASDDEEQQEMEQMLGQAAEEPHGGQLAVLFTGARAPLTHFTAPVWGSAGIVSLVVAACAAWQ